MHKNIDLLIRACKSSSTGLDIIGEGELEKDLRSLTKELQADINFLGQVPNQELPQIMNSYLGFVLCSHKEGCPKVLLEAMSCGLPCIGTRVPGIQNFIDHGLNGLLCEENETDLAKCIQRIVRDEELRLHIGKGAREYILKNCSIDSIVDKEYALYKEMCSC